MPFYTPLRYPGGKRRLAHAIMRLLMVNGRRDVDYFEPYAGGAAVALALLFEEYASTVHINDLSRPVYAFWYSALNETAELCRRIESCKVSMDEWHRQREVYDNRESENLLDLGFSALFLNRTNRSGIIAGGVVGGQQQTGKWGLDARFSNKADLIQRVRRVGRYRSRIHLHGRDALDFTREVVPSLGANTFGFYDPPYIENGEDLYLNDYSPEDHRRLSESVCRLRQPWVVTYDYAAVSTLLYPSHRRLVYGLSYSAHNRYEGREVMFLADSLALPDEWLSKRGTIPLSQRGSKHPLYGKMENMKPHHRDMLEGPPALDRFRTAMKAILAAPRHSTVTKKTTPKRKKRASNRKG